MKWSIPSIIFCIFAMATAQGQVIEERPDGRKVVVFPDGSWRPITERDSILLNSDEDFMVEDDSGINVLELPQSDEAEKVPIKTSQFKAEVNRLTKKIEIFDGKYQKFKMDPSIPKADLQALKDSLSMYDNKLKHFKNYYRPSDVINNPAEVSKNKANEFQIIPYGAPGWVDQCDHAMVKIDPLKGFKIINLPKALLLYHNIPEIATRIGQRPFMTVNGAFNTIGSYIFFNMEIKLASSAAVLQYGAIEEGEVIYLKLVDDSLIKLNNLKYDVGQTNPHKEESVYLLSFQLQSSDIRKLKRSEVELIRIIWGSGYEDYPMTNVRFFMDQLNCLDEHM